MIASSLQGLAYDLDKFGPEALPGSFDQLCDRVEEVEGVRFRELCERLPKQAEEWRSAAERDRRDGQRCQAMRDDQDFESESDKEGNIEEN